MWGAADIGLYGISGKLFVIQILLDCTANSYHLDVGSMLVSKCYIWIAWKSHILNRQFRQMLINDPVLRC